MRKYILAQESFYLQGILNDINEQDTSFLYLFIYLLTYFIRVPVQCTALPQGPIITNKIHHC